MALVLSGESVPAVRVEGLTKTYGETKAALGLASAATAKLAVWGTMGVVVAVRFFSYEPSDGGSGRSVVSVAD